MEYFLPRFLALFPLLLWQIRPSQQRLAFADPAGCRDGGEIRIL
jgi:hypothetical protein